MKYIKILLTVLIFLIVVFKPTAQTDSNKFTVIKVKGEVFLNSTKNLLKPKSSFLSKDDFQFNSQENRILSIDDKGIAYLIKPKENLNDYDLSVINAKINTKPGEILTFVSFKSFLEGRDLLIFNDSFYIELGSKEFPIDKNHFFYIRYNWNSEVVNKVLPSEGNTILILKDSLYKVDGQPIDSKEVSDYEMYYYTSDSEKEESLFINKFNLIFSDETMEKEIAIIVEVMQANDYASNEILNQIENFLFEEYGIPERENLENWLKYVGILSFPNK